MSDRRAERLQVMLTIPEVERVEEWRFDNRMPSRSAAVRALMNIGLRAHVALDDHALRRGTISSGHVGVVNNESLLVPADGSGADHPRVLVVHGDHLVGLGIRSLLADAGFAVAGPVAAATEAVRALDEGPVAAAVIDPSADAAGAAVLADALAERAIPFVFCTSLNPREHLPRRHWRVPVVERTRAHETLAAAVAGLVR